MQLTLGSGKDCMVILQEMASSKEHSTGADILQQTLPHSTGRESRNGNRTHRFGPSRRLRRTHACWSKPRWALCDLCELGAELFSQHTF